MNGPSHISTLEVVGPNTLLFLVGFGRMPAEGRLQQFKLPDRQTVRDSTNSSNNATAVCPIEALIRALLCALAKFE
jgi:hypothetical protein